MHSAPAVSYPVGRSRFQGQLIGVLTALSGVTGMWWWSVVDTPGWRQGLLVVACLFTALFSVRAWSLSPAGVLAWDGEAWRCTGVQGVVSGKVRLHLDLQFCMLVCLRSDDGGRLWLWPERRTAPTTWLALRRAVISCALDGAFRSNAETAALLNP